MTAEIDAIDQRDRRKDSRSDIDEPLDECLDHELLCFLQEDVANGDTVSAFDLDKDFLLNELETTTESDNRSVDDILLEAELIMHKQPMFAASCAEDRASRIPCVKMLNGFLNNSDFMSSAKQKDQLDVDRHRKAKNFQPTEATLNGKEIVLNCHKKCTAGEDRSATLVVLNNPSTTEAVSKEKGNWGQCTNTVSPFGGGPNASTALCTEADRKKQHYATHCSALAASFDPSQPLSSNRSEQTNQEHSPGRLMCDKSVQSSPTHDEPVRFLNWSQERSQEYIIIDLQDRLKDTEERYHSLKLQYDNLSQLHRTLRENYNFTQEESEKIQFEIQHLTKCADVLRMELQSACCARDSAIELQRTLKCELDESCKEKKRLLDCSEKSTKTIQDLQRQCREMERILMRKNPDSISALIVASESSSGNADVDGSSTCRLLEQRIAQLEADARKQDVRAQSILSDVQTRFNSVQAKYETHIADLEMQVLSLQKINSKLNEQIVCQIEELASIGSHAVSVTSVSQTDSRTQTDVIPDAPPEQHKQRYCIRTRSIMVQTDVEQPSSRQQAQQQQQTVAKRAQVQSKEDAHLLATIRGMRVDLAIKEKAVQRLMREVDECKKTIKKIQKKNGGPTHKVSENSEHDTISSLRNTNTKIKMLEMDYKVLQEKRLQDLKALQAAHEKELAACHESIRILQQRLAEREEELAHRKDKHRPNLKNDYYGLKAKVAYLERRHTEREQRLLMLVEALSK